MNFDYVRIRIANMRRERELSKKEMAHRLGMEQRNYERIESLGCGHHKHLDLELLECIAGALEVDIWQLILPSEMLEKLALN